MKKTLLGFGLGLALVSSTFAQDKEQDRVENAGTVMKEILNAPDSIPQSVLDKADCVVILPSVLKFAIGIGGSYGRGLMTCRGGSTFHGKWGPPTMMALEGGSVGLQLGEPSRHLSRLRRAAAASTAVICAEVSRLGSQSGAPARHLSELRRKAAAWTREASSLPSNRGAQTTEPRRHLSRFLRYRAACMAANSAAVRRVGSQREEPLRQ